MGRPTVVLLVLLAAVGSWFFFNELPLDGGLSGKPTGGLGLFAAPQQPGKSQVAPQRPVLRIATFAAVAISVMVLLYATLIPVRRWLPGNHPHVTFAADPSTMEVQSGS